MCFWGLSTLGSPDLWGATRVPATMARNPLCSAGLSPHMANSCPPSSRHLVVTHPACESSVDIRHLRCDRWHLLFQVPGKPQLGQFCCAWGHRGAEHGGKDRPSQSKELWLRGHTWGLLGPLRACRSELRISAALSTHLFSERSRTIKMVDTPIMCYMGVLNRLTSLISLTCLLQCLIYYYLRNN